jgi:hypothetical protein
MSMDWQRQEDKLGRKRLFLRLEARYAHVVYMYVKLGISL